MTNDFALDSIRATAGTLAAARANMAKLMTFLLAGTRAVREP